MTATTDIQHSPQPYRRPGSAPVVEVLSDKRPATPAELSALTAVFRLATSLILHPRGLTLATWTLCPLGSPSHLAIVSDKIRRVLLSTAWLAILLPLPPSQYGYHPYTPPNTQHDPRRRRCIVVNRDLLAKLVLAEDADVGRMRFLLAACIANEVVNALGTQLRDQPGVRPGEEQKQGYGTEWRDAMLGGLLGGGRYSVRAGRRVTPAFFDNMAAVYALEAEMRGLAAHAAQEYAQWEAETADDAPQGDRLWERWGRFQPLVSGRAERYREWPNSAPFDFLAIGTDPRRVFHEIDEEWIRELDWRFQLGGVEDMVFPLLLRPDVSGRRVSVLDRKERQHSCVVYY